jgi:pyruvate kinase
MLSAESATGKYPVESVETMAHVIRDTEASPLDDLVVPPKVAPDARPVAAVTGAACRLAGEVGAKAILAATTSGFTARALSRHRPPLPLIAITADPAVARQLALSWGVLSVLRRRDSGDPAALRRWAAGYVRKARVARRGDRVVLVAGLRADHAPRWEEAARVIEV